MSRTVDPQRGEVWDVRFDPTRGSEIGKQRPAVVINEPAVGRLPLRIVVPITDWKPYFSEFPWFVHLKPSKRNGLKKESGADAFQVKSISLRRFVRRHGALSAPETEDIAAAIAICIGLS